MAALASDCLANVIHELNVVITENNSPPVAVAGPDKELTFPVESTTLDGSKSQDDQGIVFYHWENIRYLEILLISSKIENKVEGIGARASCAVVFG